MYGWDRIEQTSTSGIPIPVIYGEHRVAGNVVAQFVSYNFESTKQWDTLKSFGELDIAASTPLVITTPYTTTEGIKISNAPSSVEAIMWFAKYFRARQYRAVIRVEIKKVDELVYREIGTFTLGTHNCEFIIRDDTDGKRLAPAQYNVRLTYVNESELPAKPVQRWNVNKLNASNPLFQHAARSDGDFGVVHIPNVSIYAAFLRDVVVQQNDNSNLSTLIALSEGRIESVSDIKVDEQRIDDLGPEASYSYRVGTPTQQPLPNFNSLNIQQSLGQEMTHDWYTVDTTGDVDQIEVEFSAPSGIFHVGTSGHRKGKIEYISQRIEVEWKLKGAPDGSYAALKIMMMQGGTTSLKFFGFRFDAPAGRNTYTFRYRVPTAQTIYNDSGNCNKVYMLRMNDIRFESFAYPLTALLAVNVIATDKFKGSPPNITCLVRGVHIKNLATSVVGYSNNPAWCIADMLTNTRYGLGEYITEGDLDVDSFIAAAAYYDELILDDENQQVKRATLNYVVDAGDSPNDTLQTMLAACRSYIVWSNGKFKLRVDKPEASVQSFGMDNIIKGSFTCAYIPRSSIINQVEVAFNSAIKDYEKDLILVETPEAAAGTEALRKRTADLRGVTNWQQAYRLAHYLLLSSRFTSIQVQIAVATDGLFAEPGDVVLVTHTVPGWVDKPFKIISIEELNTKELQLTLLEYHESVYNEELEPAGTPVAISEINVYETPALVRNLDVVENVVAGSLDANINVSFTVPVGASRAAPWDHANIYVVTHSELQRVPDPVPIARLVGSSKVGQFVIPAINIVEGYWIYVTSVSPAGVETPIAWAPRQFIYVTGKRPGKPDDIPKFWWSQHEKMIHFHWTPVEDLSPVEYEIREGLTWSAGVVVADHITENAYTMPVPGYEERRYMIKAKDYFGYECDHASDAQVVVYKIGRRRVILTRDELALQSGTHYQTKFRKSSLRGALPLNMYAQEFFQITDESTTYEYISTGYETNYRTGLKTVLTLQPSIKWDSGFKWDATRQHYWDLPTYAEGTYTTDVIDLGACRNVELHIECKFRTFKNWGWCGGYVDLEKSSWTVGGDALFCGMTYEEFVDEQRLTAVRNYCCLVYYDSGVHEET